MPSRTPEPATGTQGFEAQNVGQESAGSVRAVGLWHLDASA